MAKLFLAILLPLFWLGVLAQQPVPPRERVFHAKGVGAHGYFEVTRDISQITKAKFLSEKGRRTPTFARFSTCLGGRDSSDTRIDVKGFATKFYSEGEGNHDLLTNNLEPFALNDAQQFSEIVEAFRRSPVTGQFDPSALWDILSKRPEATFFALSLFSDKARPDGYQRIDGYSVNVFKFENSSGGVSYGKFRWIPEAPWKALTFKESEVLAGSSPDYNSKNLYDSINAGVYPEWKLYLQIRSEEDILSSRSNPFDLTRPWRVEQYPLTLVGKMILNRNPGNHLEEVEKVAFNPGNLVQGVAPASQDRLLAARLIAYPAAQRVRFGSSNYTELPINRPLFSSATNYPSRKTPISGRRRFRPNIRTTTTEPSPNPAPDSQNYQEDDPFEYPRLFIENELSPPEKRSLVESLADVLKLAREEVRERFLQNNIYPISKEFGDLMRGAVEYNLRNDWRDKCECCQATQQPQQPPTSSTMTPTVELHNSPWDWRSVIPELLRPSQLQRIIL